MYWMVSHAAHAATATTTRIQSASRILDSWLSGALFAGSGTTRGKRIGRRLMRRSAVENRLGRHAHPIGALQKVQHPGTGNLLAGRQLDLELVRPGDDRPEQQLIVKENDDAMVRMAALIADQFPSSFALAM